MTREMFLVLVLVVVAVIFAAMWWGWRSRARRDAGVHGTADAPTGELLAEFPRVYYVSTTPENDPMSRVAAPGLRYRGYAEAQLRRDGVTVQVRGEQPVHVAASQLRGSGLAARRAGKAVEQNGLALMKWTSDDRALESSFRFDDPAAQQRFLEAIDDISGCTAAQTQAEHTQEGTR